MYEKTLFALCATSLLLVTGCPGPDPDDDDSFEYPRDDTLRFNHLQALGTHNSYHVQTPGVELPEWAYTHLPLDEQLGLQGVRQFELDITLNADTGVFDCYHVPMLDETSNCPQFSGCLGAMKDWSDRNPAHHPLWTLLEIKDVYDEETVDDYLAALEAEILAVWPEERLITPDDVQGDAASLADALATDGWPTLGQLRGRALFVLHEGGAFRDHYTDGGTTTAGRILFPDAGGSLEHSFSAVHTVNDPIGSIETLQAVVDAGHLVRTRADADSEVIETGDTSQREAAIASGAHFVSTDYPAPVDGVDYVVVIPDGTPSRCNPRSAPSECTSADIEDPQFISE